MNPSLPRGQLLDSLTLLHASTHLGVLATSVSQVTDANDAFLKMIGYTRKELEAGLIDWRSMTAPEYAGLDERAIEELQQFGACVPFEKEYLLRDGKRLPILIGAVRLRSEPLECLCWVVNLRTQKSAAEAERQSRELKLELEAEMRGALRIYEISAGLLSQRTLVDLFSEILDAAIELTDASFGTLQILEDGVLRLVAHRAVSPEFVGFFREVSHATPAVCSAAFRSNARVIIEDVASDELFKGTESREVLLRAGIRAVQSTPLIGISGELMGMLSTHFRFRHRPPDRALRYLDLLAGRAAILVEQVKTAEIQRRAEKLAAHNHMANMLAHEINNPAQALTNILTLLSYHDGVRADAQELVRLGQEQLNRLSEDVRKLLSIETNNLSPKSETRKVVEHIRSGTRAGKEKAS